MKTLFSSADSKFFLKSGFLIVSVPLLMLLIILYSVWLLIVMNFSYFRASGLPLDGQSLQDFTNLLIQSQLDYLPYVALFFVGVFFVGMFIAHITLRPFNQLIEICHVIKEAKGEKIRIVGLSRKKILIKLGYFLNDYAEARKNDRQISIPDDLAKHNGPTFDGIFYFQFFCTMIILLGMTFFSLYIFASLLEESIVKSATTMLKDPKGISLFISSQASIFDMMIYVPSAIAFVHYCFISKLIISRVQGVTYAYVRDIREVVKTNPMRRLTPRHDDPGKDAAFAVNEVLDILHPRPIKQEKEVPAGGLLSPSRI